MGGSTAPYSFPVPGAFGGSQSTGLISQAQAAQPVTAQPAQQAQLPAPAQAAPPTPAPALKPTIGGPDALYGGVNKPTYLRNLRSQ